MTPETFAEFEASILSQLAYMKEEINRPKAAATAGPGGAPEDDTPVPFDPQNHLWHEPTDEEYAAAASLGPIKAYWDLDEIYKRLRCGYSVDGQRVRMLPELRECYAEIRRLQTGESHYFSEFCKYPCSWGAQQGLVIGGKIVGWQYQEPMPLTSPRVNEFAGYGLSDVARRLWAPVVGGPGIG